MCAQERDVSANRNMGKQLWDLSLCVDDEGHQSIDFKHRKWEFPITAKVRAANCWRVFAYLRICVFVYLCICVFVYLCICVFAYLCICVFAYLRICVFVYLRICVFVFPR